jgi:hypothetical protein
MTGWQYLAQEIETYFDLEDDDVGIVVPHPPWPLKVINDCPHCPDQSDTIHMVVDWHSRSLKGKMVLHYFGNIELATFQLDDEFVM